MKLQLRVRPRGDELAEREAAAQREFPADGTRIKLRPLPLQPGDFTRIVTQLERQSAEHQNEVRGSSGGR